MTELVALERTWRDRWLVGVRKALVDDVRIRTRPIDVRERRAARKRSVQRMIRGSHFGMVIRHGSRIDARTRFGYG